MSQAPVIGPQLRWRAIHLTQPPALGVSGRLERVAQSLPPSCHSPSPVATFGYSDNLLATLRTSTSRPVDRLPKYHSGPSQVAAHPAFGGSPGTTLAALIGGTRSRRCSGSAHYPTQA